MHKTGNGKLRRIFAPLYVMKEEKLYCIWIAFVCFFGLMNIWAGLLLWQFDSIVKSLREGIVYTYSISICAPFLAEVFVRQIVNKRAKEKPVFVSYQIASASINVIWILILTFLWLGELRGAIWPQALCGTFSSFFAFYMYCVAQMERHKELLGEFDDHEYKSCHSSGTVIEDVRTEMKT